MTARWYLSVNGIQRIEINVAVAKKRRKIATFVSGTCLWSEKCNCLFMLIYYQHILRVHCRKRDALLLNSIWQFSTAMFWRDHKDSGSFVGSCLWLMETSLDWRIPASLKVSLPFASMIQHSSGETKASPLRRGFNNSEDWKEIIQRSFLQKSSNEVINKEKHKRETGEVV